MMIADSNGTGADLEDSPDTIETQQYVPPEALEKNIDIMSGKVYVKKNDTMSEWKNVSEK